MHFLPLIFLLIGNSAWGEYRAFELVIKNPTTGQERIVISTLDPQQYRGYYPVSSEETVTYKSTWKCYGSSPHLTPICSNPKAEN